MDRYLRQISLPAVGKAGQARIRQTRVLVIGAGGLGCAALPYLCAAGVGCITIVDHDRVEESNLHRQPLYRMSDLGRAKATVARDSLQSLDPSVAVQARCERLHPANADELVRAADVVLDCADSFAVTYTLSDACVRENKPLISASVLAFSGYVGVFCGKAPSYRAVFPDLPAYAQSCATAGVLGASVGVLGTLQAQLALSLILDLQPSVYGRLISLDFRALHFGGFSFADAPEPDGPPLRFISSTDIGANDLVVDLRSPLESPRAATAACRRSTVDRIEADLADVSRTQRVVLCCRSGVRAWRAANLLKLQGRADLALIALGD